MWLAPRIGVRRTDADAIVIGAGAAGLAAASDLVAAGARVIVLEARDRLGGRVLTVRDDRLPIPIELGAEFIHGAAPETVGIVRDAGLVTCEVVGERWRAGAGTLQQTRDYWHRLDLVMRRLDGTGEDRSFQDFLDARPGGRRLARERTMAAEFVQGFHAADLTRISAHSLADGGSPGDDPDERRMGRIVDGYDAVPLWLGRGIEEVVRTAAVAGRVEWSRGNARVSVAPQGHGGQEALTSRAVIVAVPLGVLQARPPEPGSIVFDPEPPALLRHLGALASGAAMRIILAFREQFWIDRPIRTRPRDSSLACMHFLHTHGAAIPIWWTSFPVRAPMITGWVGGPGAVALSSAGAEAARDTAIGILARELRIPRRTLSALLTGWWTHDWLADPFSRGAYSYPLVGGSEASKHLARPVESTLFFAGEAMDSEQRSGTVHGAIGSGRRAARGVLKALG